MQGGKRQEECLRKASMRDRGTCLTPEAGEETVCLQNQGLEGMRQSPWLQAGSSLSKPHSGVSGGGCPRAQFSLRPGTATSSWEVPL